MNVFLATLLPTQGVTTLRGRMGGGTDQNIDVSRISDEKHCPELFKWTDSTPTLSSRSRNACAAVIFVIVVLLADMLIFSLQ